MAERIDRPFFLLLLLIEGAAGPGAAWGDQGVPEGVCQWRRVGESCWPQTQHPWVPLVPTQLYTWTGDRSVPTGKPFVLVGLLHNSCSKLFINSGKRGPCFGFVLLLLLILVGKPGAKSKVAAQAKPLRPLVPRAQPYSSHCRKQGGCRVAGRLSITFCFRETSRVKLPGALPCPALPLSCFTA